MTTTVKKKVVKPKKKPGVKVKPKAWLTVRDAQGSRLGLEYAIDTLRHVRKYPNTVVPYYTSNYSHTAIPLLESIKDAVNNLTGFSEE